MKKLFILVVTLMCLLLVHWGVYEGATQSVGGYKVVGKITDPLLLQLIHAHRQEYRIGIVSSCFARQRKPVIVDGTQMSDKEIEENEDIHAAVAGSSPIVISKPTENQLSAITGAGLVQEGVRTVVILPSKQGHNFSIHVVSTHKDKITRRSEQESVQMIQDMIKNYMSKIDSNEEPKEKGDETECTGCHKRWTVKEAIPTTWGRQRHFMDVGFQYDLYYVVKPKPARKYVTVKTIGRGVSSGNLAFNDARHRGYFLREVTVDIRNYSKEWKGNHLTLESIAPGSENQSNSVSITTGASFSGFIGNTWTTPLETMTQSPMFNTGVTLEYSKGLTKNFNDFTVSAEPPSNLLGLRWSYWMSGAGGGASIRRDRRRMSKDMVSCILRCKLRELPRMAQGDLLMPNAEAVYFADHNETGKRVFITEVSQHLEDLQLTNRITGNVIATTSMNTKKSKMTIDFSEVSCK